VSKDATEIVERWGKRLPTLLPEYESEKPFYNFHDPEFEHLKITGKIDLLEKQNEIQVQVTDFKTGSVKKSVDIEREGEEGRMSDYLRQLTMYSFLLAGTSHDQLEVVSSRLEFVEAEDDDKHAVYATHITGEHIDRLRQDIRDYDKLLKSGKWIERPCYFKSYWQIPC
jgi:RecB family exonuclease